MKFARLVHTRALCSLIASAGCAGDSKTDGKGQQMTAAGRSSSAPSSPSASSTGTAASGGNSAAGSSGRVAADGGGSGGAAIPNGTSGASGSAGATAGRGAAGAAGATTSAGAGASGRAGAAAGVGGQAGGAAGVAGSSAGAGAAGNAAAGSGGSTTGSASPMMNFFVSSSTSMTANLNGLSGADQRCQSLAQAVGAGGKTWRAYLSAENPATNAIDRIGPGPYYNAQGMMLAADKAALHARAGDAALFLTEKGEKVNGQWIDSPRPNEHDILTGTKRDGTLAAGMTCADWTATTGMSQVGHSDGLGPNQATSGMYSYWNSVHTGQCGNTAPGGGAGRIYCFVSP